jgi:hypothetical protein
LLLMGSKEQAAECATGSSALASEQDSAELSAESTVVGLPLIRQRRLEKLLCPEPPPLLRLPHNEVILTNPCNLVLISACTSPNSLNSLGTATRAHSNAVYM